MKIENVTIGTRVVAMGYEQHGDELRILRRPDAPQMVVRDVIVQCAWFVDGVMNTASFHVDELAVVQQ